MSARVINEEKRHHYHGAASLTSGGRHLEIININGVINGKGKLRLCEDSCGAVTLMKVLLLFSQIQMLLARVRVPC